VKSIPPTSCNPLPTHAQFCHLSALGERPHLDHYFGVWSILEDVFQTFVQCARTLNLQAHLDIHARSSASLDRSLGFTRAGNVAIVDLFGTLTKHASSFTGGTSTLETRRMIRDAADDPNIMGILSHVDSPGGTVAGTNDLAQDVASAATRKPVHAFVEDLSASAA
jgi:ClpP class serine protease